MGWPAEESSQVSSILVSDIDCLQLGFQGQQRRGIVISASLLPRWCKCATACWWVCRLVMFEQLCQRHCDYHSTRSFLRLGLESDQGRQAPVPHHQNRRTVFFTPDNSPSLHSSPESAAIWISHTVLSERSVVLSTEALRRFAPKLALAMKVEAPREPPLSAPRARTFAPHAPPPVEWKKACPARTQAGPRTST